MPNLGIGSHWERRNPGYPYAQDMPQEARGMHPRRRACLRAPLYQLSVSRLFGASAGILGADVCVDDAAGKVIGTN